MLRNGDDFKIRRKRRGGLLELDDRSLGGLDVAQPLATKKLHAPSYD
jgi:hypothetical protein